MQADDAANYYVNILLPGSDYVADPRPPPPPHRVPISLGMALPSPRSLLLICMQVCSTKQMVMHASPPK